MNEAEESVTSGNHKICQHGMVAWYLDVAVNEVERVHEGERLQHLLHDLLQPNERVVDRQLVVADVAAELVEVLPADVDEDGNGYEGGRRYG